MLLSLVLLLMTIEARDGCVPDSVRVEGGLRKLLPSLCHDSLTFRRQCARIATRSDLTVVVRLESTRQSSRLDAWTTFSSSTGPVRAEISIRPSPDVAELIGHEFEHVVEWLDGVHDVPRSRERGVVVDGQGRLVETTRAIQVGRMVAREWAAARVESRGADRQQVPR